MKMTSFLAVAAALVTAASCSAGALEGYIVTTNTFTFSGTYAYNALSTNGAIIRTASYSVSSSTRGGNLFNKGTTSYTTNYSDVTVLSTASFATKDFLAAINLDLTNNPSLSNFLANVNLTSLPAATSLKAVTEVNSDGNDFQMYLYLVVPVGGTNVAYDLSCSGMFKYDTSGDYVFSRNLQTTSTSAGTSYSGLLTGIVPVQISLYSMPDNGSHAELDLEAIGTGTLNWAGTNVYTGKATTTFTLSPMAGNIYVLDAHSHTVTGVFTGSGSGTGTGRLNPEG
jgi:hypothetical protein